MQLTAITRALSPYALKSLTAQALKPSVHMLEVAAPPFADELRVLNACVRGERFHEAAANLLGEEKIPREDRPFFPYLKTIRSHLRSLGYCRFETEYTLSSGCVTGRADLVASGQKGRAVIEFKTGSLPDAVTDLETMVQAGNYGYMLPRRRGTSCTALMVYYVDLRRCRIAVHSWRDHRNVCRPLRELRAA